MRRRMVSYITGRVLIAEAFLMLPSMLVGLIYREIEALAFLPSIALMVILGLLLGFKKPQNDEFFARDGFVSVALCWILLALFGAIPFALYDNLATFGSYWNCLFEIVSGLTTTGASILPAPESLPYCMLFWRSFSHWVGGMGVLVLVLAVMPLAGDRSLHLMRAEVPGPTVGKLVPRMRKTAFILYAVYTALTAILVLLLIIGGMPLFDSICHAMATAGTGGFSVKNAGISAYGSAYIETVLAVFMILFGVNFNLFYLILIGRAKTAFKSEELRVYLSLVAAASLLIFWNTFSTWQNAGRTLLDAFFQVSSIISSTGFATVNFSDAAGGGWPIFSQTILLLLMFIGACAGSTGGGIKVSRVVILFKSAGQEIRQLIHPRAKSVVRLEGKPLETSMLHGTLIYAVIYFLIIILSTLLLSFFERRSGFDFTTIFSAEVTCFNNIGPGLNAVGPTSNFLALSPASKVVLMINMLLGRLEIYPLLILLAPRRRG